MIKQKISCVIACYKDGQAIPIMYERIVKTFEDLPVDYEIIFVNDASPDNTIDELKKITGKDKNVIGINHRRNFGSQSAFLSGLKISTGDAVVLLDGDLQDPPELIKDFYFKWQEGFNVVYGLRLKREVSWLMQVAYKAFYRIFNKVASFKVPTDAGDFSLIDRQSVNEILKFGEFDIFLRAIRAYIGGSQVGIPYLRPERMFGKSTNNVFKNIGWATKGILAVSRVPLTLISVFSTFFIAIFLTIGIGFVIYSAISSQTNFNGWINVFLIINFVLLLLCFLSIAIVGEYVGRILEETKNRPRYLIANFVYKGDIIPSIENFLNEPR